MKKNSFIHGAFIATMAIMISKIIGLLYVVLFYPLVGEQGGALYGYAYTIYGMFLNISTAGIPFAISRIISEYHCLNQEYLKEKTYKIGKYAIFGLGFIAFLLLFIFSNDVAYMFIGNIQGGNSKEDVSFVIKVVSTALLIVPSLSVARGYLQGQKYITPSSFSQVLEQTVRVTFLLIGSFLTLKVFNLSLKTAVGIAVFAATIGGLAAYFYLISKIKKHEKDFNRNAKITDAEKCVTTRVILKKILSFSIPFILIDLVRSGYSFVDLTTINRTMVNLGYPIGTAESLIGILTTWGMKLNSIVYAISTGIIVSLIPNVTTSYVLDERDNIKRKINMSLQVLIFTILPIVVGLSLLSHPVWVLFFGASNKLGPMVFALSVYTTLIISIFNTTVSILHSMAYSKIVVFTLIVGFILKSIFNVPLMYAFDKIGMHPAYGVTLATIIAYFISFLLNLSYIKRRLNITLSETSNRVIKTIFITAIMTIVILLLELVLPINTTSRLLALLICIVYAIVGGIVYIFMSIKTGIVYEIFGNDIFKKIATKFKMFKKPNNKKTDLS